MGMKFLNKKGWHTGSLRNIENVWKAEQKHEAEQKKLEELKKQIHEERERAEFRQLQEQAGLIPKQERLDFLYESGLAVGKGSSSFKALESLPKTDPETTASSSASVKQQQQPAVPGALFEEKEKPQSANDAWRKLHSDPLLMIRQREQEALARVKNNPVQMAMIRKSVESKKDKDKDEKKQKSKHHKKKSKHRKHSSSENDSDPEDAHLAVEKQRERHQKGSNSDKPSHKATHDSDEESSKRDDRRKKYYDHEYKHRRPSEAPNTKSDPEDAHLTVEKQRERHQKGSNSDKPSRKATHDSDEEFSKRDDRRKKYDDHEYKHQRPSEAPNTKSDPEDAHLAVEKQRERHQKGSNSDKPSRKATHDSDEEFSKRDDRRKKYDDNEYKHQRPSEAPNTKSDPEDAHLTVEKQRERHQKGSNSDKPSRKATHDSDEELSKRDDRRKKYDDHEYKHRRPSEAPNTKSDPEDAHLAVEKQRERHQKGSNSDKPSRKANHDSDEEYSKRDDRRKKYYDNEYKHRRPSEAPNMKYDRSEGRHEKPPHITSSDKPPRNESNNRHRKSVKLSEEERAARLREMQMDAERHEQQRWKRLKKAADSDAQETIRDNASMGRNFLDAAQKSVFGAEKGGSSTIEESVRRRTHYSQGKSASESNAFRR